MEELSLSLACVLFSGRLFLLGQGVGLDVGFFAISFEQGWVFLATRVLELAQGGGALLVLGLCVVLRAIVSSWPGCWIGCGVFCYLIRGRMGSLGY